LILPSQAQSQRQPIVHLPLVVDPRSIVGLVEGRMHRNGLVRVMHLPKQHRSERVTRISWQNIARRVIACCLKVIENKMTALVAGRPTHGRELMPAVFKTYLNGVFTFLPGQVVRELPPVVSLKAEPRPTVRAYRVVRDGALEIDERWSRRVIKNTALRRSRACPQQRRPASPCRQRIPAHEPAVPRDGGVVEEVSVDDPVK